jgi:hypothetical protein
MHTITLKIQDDSIYTQFMAMLRSWQQVEVTEDTQLTANAKAIKIAHMQSLIDEGIASGMGTRSMSELKEIAKSRIASVGAN